MPARAGDRQPSGRQTPFRWLQDAAHATSASRVVQRVLGVDRKASNRAGPSANPGADREAGAAVAPNSVEDKVSAALRSNATCSICMDILAAPHRNFCGHAFCGACLGSWAEKGARLRCPVCRKRLRDVVPDVVLEGFIDSLSASGLSSEDLANLKERSHSWADVKEEMYESWIRMGIKVDNSKESSGDCSTDDSEDGDERPVLDDLYDDPNEDLDIDTIRALERLELTDSDSDDEPQCVTPGNLDWTSPLYDPIEWNFDDHPDAADPDSEIQTSTDIEDPVLEGEQNSEWDRPIDDPTSTEWSFDAQLEAVDPSSDATLVPELFRMRLQKMYERGGEGWNLYECSVGDVDPESEGETESGSDHREQLLGGRASEDAGCDCSDLCGEAVDRHRLVAWEAPGEGARTSSGEDYGENGCPFGSDGELSLPDPSMTHDFLDYPHYFDEEPHALESSQGATDSEHGGLISSEGQPSEWEGLYDAASEWLALECGTADPDLESGEETSSSDAEDCGDVGADVCDDGPSWSDYGQDSGCSFSGCGIEGEQPDDSYSDPSGVPSCDCNCDDGWEAASSLGLPSQCEDSGSE
ncbi:unnamed protein product [Ostreobium quekettii]|uniref:RING-type E3 ubiquitin transferase n=1 Tax=Ostreobium quekettii TaxID=121088 RepID=A0A8S1IMN8_9CHLO|nr:unnamed protein product [Ostreobium quekettii]|eukprot:evm.model.scf_448.7 EVM.evm.TU.scf_448.7   scf_448:76880-80662(+)